MFVVGITGGIGCGKSAVTDRLAEKNIPVIDADIVAREVVTPGMPALAAIAKRFGEDILLEDGSLNRARLRTIVFASEKERNWLEQLLHPQIRDSILEKLESLSGDYAVLSSPLLLETDQHLLVNHIVVVDTTEEIQIARTTARDNNTEAQVRAIIAAQMPRDERLAKADTVLPNCGNRSELDAAVVGLHKKLLMLATQEQDA